MSPAEQLFWQRVQRRASGLTPELAAAILRAYAIIRDQLTESQLRAIAHNAALLDDLLTQQILDRAFVPVRETLYRQTRDAVTYFARDLPGAGRVNGHVVVTFDVLNPKVIEAIRALDTKIIRTLQQQVRDSVRAVVERGLVDGIGPRAIGRNLREVIGLAPNQQAAVANFRAALEAGDLAKARGYALRDKRFALKPDLTPAQVDTMVAAYERRMVAFNAETNARTATLDALKLGQRLAWESAIDRGLVDGSQLYKRWSGVLDLRERDAHLAMEGEIVRWDQPFSNGEMIPGDSTYNCRCLAMYFVWRGVGEPPAAGAVRDRQSRARTLLAA